MATTQPPQSTPMHRVKIWLREDIYQALQAHAAAERVSQSEIIRTAVVKHLGEEAAGQTAPWLADMLDAVLSRYFQGFPETLQRLVFSTYEAQSWNSSGFVKLLELTGDKNTESQNQRVAKMSNSIAEFADRKTAEFFQALNGPEELIEPDESTAE